MKKSGLLVSMVIVALLIGFIGPVTSADPGDDTGVILEPHGTKSQPEELTGFDQGSEASMESMMEFLATLLGL